MEQAVKEQASKEQNVNHLKWMGIGVVILAIGTPIALSRLMHNELFSNSLGDANGWLGYWGGYFGAIIGAITVFIATSLQLQLQKSLQKETLEVQLESMIESAKLNDKQQRELTISTLRVNKIDSVVQELLHLNILNFERFNILRQYNYYDCVEKNLVMKIKRDHLLLKTEKTLNRRDAKSIKIKIMDNEKKRIANNELINKLLEQETFKRNEIRLSSAKIKSEAMFVKDLDEQLDDFRGYQDEIIDLFYEANRNNNLTWNEYDDLIENHTDKFMRMNNKTIRKCKSRLDEELLLFEEGNNKESS